MIRCHQFSSLPTITATTALALSQPRAWPRNVSSTSTPTNENLNTPPVLHVPPSVATPSHTASTPLQRLAKRTRVLPLLPGAAFPPPLAPRTKARGVPAALRARPPLAPQSSYVTAAHLPKLLARRRAAIRSRPRPNRDRLAGVSLACSLPVLPPLPPRVHAVHLSRSSTQLGVSAKHLSQALHRVPLLGVRGRLSLFRQLRRRKRKSVKLVFKSLRGSKCHPP